MAGQAEGVDPIEFQTILGVLLCLLRRGSHVMEHEVREARVPSESRTDVPDLQQICLLRSRLTPFFMIVHPIRGQVLGPFTQIPSAALHVRYLALDLCASLVTDQTRSGVVEDKLCDAVFGAVQVTRDALYWDGVRETMRSDSPARTFG